MASMTFAAGCKMVLVLLLANGAAGLPGLLLTNRATAGLIPSRNGRNPAGLSKPEALPPPRWPLALAERVASTGATCGTYVLLTSRLGLAATKTMAAQGTTLRSWTPPPAFWSTMGSAMGTMGTAIVPLSVVLGMIILGLKITSAENTALITSLDTTRQRELTKMDTERKADMTRIKTDMTQMITELKDMLASNLVEIKTANAAEVERLVTSEIADQRLVSVDDQAQVAKDTDAG